MADKGKRVSSMTEPILLKSLSEHYARRAREFSESVALLGRHNSVGPEVLKLFKKIKRQRGLCGVLKRSWSDTYRKRLWTPKWRP
jgi:hypothetical protein